MCFDIDAHPPLPPIHGAALDAGDLILTSADGTRVAAYAARASKPSGAGIVICPDVRGLVPYYEELALRFAEAGVDADRLRLLQPHRRERASGMVTSTISRRSRSPGRSRSTRMWPLPAAHLRTPEGGSVSRLFTVGFCFGGRISYLQAARPELDLGGVIGFYGWPVGEHRTGLASPAEMAPQFTCSVLALWGGADQGDPGGGARRVRCGHGRRGEDARQRRLRRRNPLLLRPACGRVRRCIGRCMAPNARLLGCPRVALISPRRP